MPRAKVVRRRDEVVVEYGREHWELLESLRERALEVMRALARAGVESFVHGSVARGDVHPDSDVDVVIPYPVSPPLVEEALEIAGLPICEKEISQATPRHAVKISFYLDEKTSVTFPLSRLSRLELEFYKFSGKLGLEELKRGARVPGVNKSLLAIVPIEEGHVEFSVLGREREVARLLGVSLDIVRERVSVLTRRDEVGRTGVFVHRVIAPEDSVTRVVEEIARRNPLFRKRLEIA